MSIRFDLIGSVAARSLAVVAILAACARTDTSAGVDSTASRATSTSGDTAQNVAAPASTTSVVDSHASLIIDSVAAPGGSAQEPLRCSPTTLHPGDTLTIRMSIPHGHYLTVTRSGGTTYFLVFPPVQSNPALSLMPSEEFARVGALRIPAAVRGVPYVYGRDTTLESVFDRPGKYLLQVGDNIGTDSGTPPASCDLTVISDKSH